MQQRCLELRNGSAERGQADGEASFIAAATLQNPALWSVETPVLYSALVTVQVNGKTRDAERVRFAVRSISFEADNGFFLNGKSVKIKGTCNYQDDAGVGAAPPDKLQWFRLAVLKEMGSNAVRTSHNMPTPEWVEACNRMGMMNAVRDPHDELHSRGSGATGDDGEEIPQLAGDRHVVDGQ